MVDQTETYVGCRGESEKKFWRGCPRTAQEGWHGNFHSCDFLIHVMDVCSSKILSHQWILFVQVSCLCNHIWFVWSFIDVPIIGNVLIVSRWILISMCQLCSSHQFSSVQSLSHVQLFVTSWTAARQASLSITNSQSLLKLMSIVSVMPSNHLILCRPLLLLPSIFPSIRVFSKKSVLHIRWPKHWSFSFSISPSNEYSGQISFRMDELVFLHCKGLSRVFSNTTVQKHQFFGAQPSSQSNSHIHTWLLKKP